MPQLRACDSCSRHVWSHELTCPFCGCEITSVPEPTRIIPRSGLSRSQRLVLAAALAGQALGACAETTNGAEVPPDGGPLAGRAGSAGGASVAGATAAGRGGVVVGGNGGLGFMPTPPYGISPVPPPPPPPPDAGKKPNPPDDAGDQDAGTE
jgi:hypothetical protein